IYAFISIPPKPTTDGRARSAGKVMNIGDRTSFM
ncbi:hypothetical protein IYQ_22255, partial [Aeromonas salmonicida subsp. salmonicida 01-B526]